MTGHMDQPDYRNKVKKHRSTTLPQNHNSGLLTVSSEVVMASTGRLLSLWEAHNKEFPQNFLLISELFCFLLFVVFCAQELYRVIADGGKVFTEQQYETVLRLMILQGQSTATQSTAEYKRKLKLALAGRRVSSITH